MKKKESFLVQIVRDEEAGSSEAKGSIVHVKTGIISYFKGFEQLIAILSRFLSVSDERTKSHERKDAEN